MNYLRESYPDLKAYLGYASGIQPNVLKDYISNGRFKIYVQKPDGQELNPTLKLNTLTSHLYKVAKAELAKNNNPDTIKEVLATKILLTHHLLFDLTHSKSSKVKRILNRVLNRTPSLKKIDQLDKLIKVKKLNRESDWMYQKLKGIADYSQQLDEDIRSYKKSNQVQQYIDGKCVGIVLHSGNLEILNDFATLLKNDPAEAYSIMLKLKSENPVTFSRLTAIFEHFSNHSSPSDPNFLSINNCKLLFYSLDPDYYRQVVRIEDLNS